MIYFFIILCVVGYNFDNDMDINGAWETVRISKFQLKGV
jgi:hypothetical protein